MNRGESVEYEFGPFRLLPRERLLLRDGRPVGLTPKAFDTLVAIVERSGRLVEKEELMELVWPKTTVEEATIAQNVFALRRALGGGGSGTDFIETVPKRGYRFLPNVRVVAGRDDSTNTVARLTLAVLPLVVLSANPATVEGEYLSVGFADAFITRLSDVRGLIVRPTASVIHHSSANAIEAGRALGANAVLDGKIRIAGNGIRITLQLIRVSDGALLWADSFDGRMNDIFRLEDAVLRKLATVVVPQLTGEQVMLAGRGTHSRPAYAAYCRGRFYWNQFVPQLLPKRSRRRSRSIPRSRARTSASRTPTIGRASSASCRR